MNETAPRSSLTRRRTAEIVTRTAHIAAMALLAGGQYFGAGSAALRPWALLTVATGVGLVVAEASHSRHWAYQARGVLVLLHVAAVGLIAFAPSSARAWLATALVLGSVGSHLPRGVRKWSLRHRRIVD